MKRIIVIQILILACFTFAIAQKPGETKTQPTTKPAVKEEAKKEQAVPNPLAQHFINKYSLASRWGDLEVAKSAMYDLIIQYPGSDSLIFALAYFYYENQKYASGALICQDLLARTPKNTQVLELAATCFEGLNVYDRALQNYESLFLIGGDNMVLYKMAFLQYELKRYPECITNTDILLSKPEVDKLKLLFNDASNKQKEYAMRVALLNLKGVVSRDQADKVNAKKFFEQALAIAPDFEPAKKNLAELK